MLTPVMTSPSHLRFPIKGIDEDYVGGYGHLDAKYMVVIPEAPLTKNGLFPTSKSQMDLFRKMVQTHWKKVYITPLVKYRRNANAKTLYAKDIRYWLPVLYQEIDIVRPERILVMGKFAAKYLIPRFVSMAEDHGTLFPLTGKELDDSLSHLEDMILVPTFSFVDLQSNLVARDYFQRDLDRFGHLEFIKPEWTVLEKLADIPLPDNVEITIDIESNDLDINGKMHMCGVGYEDNLFIVWHPESDDIAQFMDNLNRSRCDITFHNATFDMAYLMKSSKGKAKLPERRIKDVMVNAHISGVVNKSLKHLTSLHTDLPGPHSGGRFFDEQYLAEDLRSTLALSAVPALNRAKDTYADHLYHDLAPIFVEMRLRGVYIDRDLLVELLVRSEQDLAKAESHLNSFVSENEINWNSGPQVAKAMIDFGVPLTEKTPSGDQYSTSEAVLLELISDYDQNPQYVDQIQMVKALLQYRAVSKLVSGFLRSYIDLLDDLNLIYPNLKLLGTGTGRLSCANPNLQQVGREFELKRAFKPRWSGSHYYGLVDFDGAELRTAAIVSGDDQMAEFILSGDPHSFMAKLAFPNVIPQDADLKTIKKEFTKYRKASKKTTFAQMYGGSIAGIAKKNSLPPENVQAVKDALIKYCPRLMNWIEKTKEEAVINKRSYTLFGNQRDLTDKWLYEGKGGVERAAINMPAQGGAGILALIVLRKVHQLSVERGTTSMPIFGVHDSILFEIAEHELESYGKLVQEAYLDIENSPIVEYPVYHKLGITGTLEVGRDWAAVEDTSLWTDILHSIPCDSRGL